MQDGLYEKVRRKRSELESLTKDLGTTAATLRDHEALIKEKASLLQDMESSI